MFQIKGLKLAMESEVKKRSHYRQLLSITFPVNMNCKVPSVCSYDLMFTDWRPFVVTIQCPWDRHMWLCVGVNERYIVKHCIDKNRYTCSQLVIRH